MSKKQTKNTQADNAAERYLAKNGIDPDYPEAFEAAKSTYLAGWRANTSQRSRDKIDRAKTPQEFSDALIKEFAASGFAFYLQFIPAIALLVSAIQAYIQTRGRRELKAVMDAGFQAISTIWDAVAKQPASTTAEKDKPTHPPDTLR